MSIAAKEAAETLTRVLPIKMAIRRRRGCDKRRTTLFALFDFSSESCFKIILFIEKKAVSDAEKKADNIKNTANATK